MGQTRLEHISILFKQLCILKFVYLIKFKTAVIMSKAYHNKLPDNKKKFKLYVSTHNTRLKDTFSSYRVHTNIKSVCISICGVKLWNSLYKNIIPCRGIRRFKNHYKVHLYVLGLKSNHDKIIICCRHIILAFVSSNALLLIIAHVEYGVVFCFYYCGI